MSVKPFEDRIREQISHQLWLILQLQQQLDEAKDELATLKTPPPDPPKS